MNNKLCTCYLFLILMCACSKNINELNIPEIKHLESQEIRIETDKEVYIEGSLELVNNKTLVIFIAGSGPTDRNCNNNIGLNTDAFKKLAYFLKGEEISSFRFDKRGIGKSSAYAESDLTIGDYINDVEKIVAYFKNQFDKIILLGHSEGAIIGSIASQIPEIHSFISIGGGSKRLDKVLLDQLAKFPALVPLAEKHIEEIKNGQELSEVNHMLHSLFRPSIVPFLKSLFSINPIAEISRLDKPVLIIGGSCDIQVSTENAVSLHQAARKSSIAIIDNMGHVMKELEDNCENTMEAYSNPDIRLNQRLKESILQFILNQKL